jgi:xanthine dehydrogenase YagS FAD-binding subunit
MKPFVYERAEDPSGAVATMVRRGAAFLAGGTNLVDLMKLGVTAPDLLVDVRDLPYHDVERLPEGGLRIGSLVANSDLAEHPAVRADYPAVAQALLAGASGQLRNRATVGGNLMQRTRCRYFQDVTKACNKRAPGAGCAALDGEHHDLAILGASAQCVATHPSDLAVALSIMDAQVEFIGPHGPEAISVHDLFRRPGDRPDRDTNLPHGALITGVVLPALPMAGTSAYRKVRDRASFAFALVSVAAIVQRDGSGRVALGGVAHKPWRVEAAERDLPRGANAVARTLLADARTTHDNAFKVPLVQRTLASVLAEAKG